MKNTSNYANVWVILNKKYTIKDSDNFMTRKMTITEKILAFHAGLESVKPNDLITAKIDVTKITKGKLFVGKSGTYLDVVLVPTPDNQYGNDFMVVESTTKEERAANVKGVILGNAKIVKKQEPQKESIPSFAERAKDGIDDLPF